MTDQPTRHELQQVIDAIRGTGQWASSDTGQPVSSGGVVTVVARRLRVTRQTVYGYLQKWATAREALDDERNSMIDLAESKLFAEVNAGNITAIIFALKTIGKSRGYVERAEVTGVDGGELVIEVVKREKAD